jgi:hypothetical protein
VYVVPASQDAGAAGPKGLREYQKACLSLFKFRANLGNMVRSHLKQKETALDSEVLKFSNVTKNLKYLI